MDGNQMNDERLDQDDRQLARSDLPPYNYQWLVMVHAFWHGSHSRSKSFKQKRIDSSPTCRFRPGNVRVILSS